MKIRTKLNKKSKQEFLQVLIKLFKNYTIPLQMGSVFGLLQRHT